MSDPPVDVGDIGQACSAADCRVIDFLPFECDFCHRQFCKDHRSATSHACADEGKDERKPTKEAPFVKHRCTLPGCSEGELVAVACERCDKTFCLSHRHPLSHPCIDAPVPEQHRRPQRTGPALPTKSTTASGSAGASAGAGAGAGPSDGAAPEKTPTSKPKKKKPKKPLTAKQLAFKRKIAVTKLKAKAPDTSKVAPAKRFFVQAILPSGPIAMCCNEDHSVGRVLDAAAVRGGLRNRNNETVDDDERLYCFVEDGTEPLAYDAKLAALATLDVLASGDTIEVQYGLARE